MTLRARTVRLETRVGESIPNRNMKPTDENHGLAWQIGVWDRMAQPYASEVDQRFSSVVEGVVARARLRAGERVLDVGAGTGAVASQAASLVGSAGHVTAMDISSQMLNLARRRAIALQLRNMTCCEGRAEQIPAASSSFDVVLASLSLMYVIDRAAAVREIARVLRPRGRFVAAVWAGAPDCDIVRFQEIAGGFAPVPPASGLVPEPWHELRHDSSLSLAKPGSRPTSRARYWDLISAILNRRGTCWLA